MTPEGEIKKWVDTLLESFSTHTPLWWFKPVQHGLGRRALDYIGCCNGHFFAVETKAPGEDLTPFQHQTAKMMHDSGARVFIISSIPGIKALGKWMQGTKVK